MSDRHIPLSTWLWIVASLAVILTTGLAAGWLLQRYDQNSGFDTEAAQIAQLLGVGPGSIVADVLAGSGKWSIDLARRVGPDGLVYSTESGEAQLERLRSAVAEAVARNIRVLESTDDSGLPARCCDALLVRAAYHDLKSRELFDPTLRRALRPGGRLVVIDFDQGTPEHQSGHGISRHRLVDELTEAGFKAVRIIDDWFGNAYCVVFEASVETTH